MRVVKKETLTLISCWVSKSLDSTMVKEHFLPPLLHTILADYNCNVPQAREPEVLSCVTTIVDKLEVGVGVPHCWVMGLLSILFIWTIFTYKLLYLEYFVMVLNQNAATPP